MHLEDFAPTDGALVAEDLGSVGYHVGHGLDLFIGAFDQPIGAAEGTTNARLAGCGGAANLDGGRAALGADSHGDGGVLG